MVKFLAYLKSDIFRKNLIAAILVLTAVLLLVFFSLRIYTRHGQEISVPDLKGMLIEDATRILKAQSFDYELDSVFQVDAEPGLVIEQDPAPGTAVKKNRTLYLTIITRTAPEVSFPDLIEKTFIESRAILNSYGLKLGDTIYRSDIARDVVLEVQFGGQPINVGRQIPKGSVIDLILGNGRGASTVEIPDLFGLTLTEARFALQGASLKLGTTHYEGIARDSLSATIRRQSPPAGSSLVSIGTPIDIYLGN